MDKILVCSYNNFEILAHKVKGLISHIPIGVLDSKESSANPINVNCINPAFAITKGNFIYVCCESINDGYILTLNKTSLEILNKVSTQGKSSCYLEIDSTGSYMININYWDSSITVHPILDNIVQEAIQKISPSFENQIYTINDHLIDRQKTSHHHSCAFYKGDLYVPDLGTDRIDIYSYLDGNLEYKDCIELAKKSGPRYILFINNFLYVINELSSSVTVIDMEPFPRFIQNIKTIPDDFSCKNTCGTIKYNKTYKHIYASNRGHNSICMFELLPNGLLKVLNIVSTYGETPRHFDISQDNTKLYVANQDTNELVYFKILDDNLKILKKIPYNSPNFILDMN